MIILRHIGNLCSLSPLLNISDFTYVFATSFYKKMFVYFTERVSEIKHHTFANFEFDKL